MIKLLSNIFYLAFGLTAIYIVYAIVVGDIDLTDKFIFIGNAITELIK